MKLIYAERFPHPVLELTNGPFVSLYMPTSRLTTETKENAIRFKNLLKIVEAQLGKGWDKKSSDTIYNGLKTLGADTEFWSHQLDGLAILAAEDQCVIYRLQRDVREYAEVSDRFHIKPLLYAYQGDDSYQVLALNKTDFKLFEGNIYALREVMLPEEERVTLKDVVGDLFEENHISTVSQGGRGSTYGGGTGSKRDEEAVDTEKYFRFVDRYVAEKHSKRTDLPLILAGLPEYHAEFHKLSHNTHLVEDGIRKDTDAMDLKTLREAAWSVMEPRYLENITAHGARFLEAQSKGNGSSDLEEVAKAALDGRVEVLMLDLDKIIPGRLTLEDGTIGTVESDAEKGDVLNDLALASLVRKSKIFVLPQGKMPVDSGVAAIYRY